MTPQSVTPTVPGTVPTPGSVLPSIDVNSQVPVTADQQSQTPLALQNVAAIRPADATGPGFSNLARIQAAWLAALFALFGFLFHQARKPAAHRGGHRRTGKGRFEA
ncbi:hypothetical protein GCM10010468_75630 [Actinocorallia longicatena]|uniref:MYXO-CTERM domain-containing protein n=1 Tax=Actinocorallia longicatena TaxID=111803 RepID=A0ABP6QML4_9ACTN